MKKIVKTTVVLGLLGLSLSGFAANTAVVGGLGGDDLTANNQQATEKQQAQRLSTGRGSLTLNTDAGTAENTTKKPAASKKPVGKPVPVNPR